MDHLSGNLRGGGSNPAAALSRRQQGGDGREVDLQGNGEATTGDTSCCGRVVGVVPVQPEIMGLNSALYLLLNLQVRIPPRAWFLFSA